SQQRPYLPQLWEEATVDGGAKIVDAEAASRAATRADLPGRHQAVMEPPPRNRLVVIDEELAHLVQQSAVGSRMIPVQRRQRGKTRGPRGGVVAVGSVDAVVAQTCAQRFVHRGQRPAT